MENRIISNSSNYNRKFQLNSNNNIEGNLNFNERNSNLIENNELREIKEFNTSNDTSYFSVFNLLYSQFSYYFNINETEAKERHEGKGRKQKEEEEGKRKEKQSKELKNYNFYHDYNPFTLLNKQHYINSVYSTPKIKREDKLFYQKLVACTIFICLYVMLNYVFFRKDFSYELKCFNDKAFHLTQNIYEFLVKNDFWLDLHLIIAGFLMDFAIIYGFLHFAISFLSWRMPFSVFLMYYIRGQLHNVYIMAHPEEYAFRYPGVFSITVPYFKTNDYFFSGHISVPLIIGMEFRRHGFHKTFFFYIFISLFEMLTMINLRGHYSIDIYAGVIFSFYIYRVGEFVSPYLDSFINKKLFRFTDEEVRKYTKDFKMKDDEISSKERFFLKTKEIENERKLLMKKKKKDQERKSSAISSTNSKAKNKGKIKEKERIKTRKELGLIFEYEEEFN